MRGDPADPLTAARGFYVITRNYKNYKNYRRII